LSQQASSMEAIAPQDTFLPGVGVEGLAAPSTEDTLVLRSDCASGHGRLLGTVETIVVVWGYPHCTHPCRAGMTWVFGFH